MRDGIPSRAGKPRDHSDAVRLIRQIPDFLCDSFVFRDVVDRDFDCFGLCPVWHTKVRRRRQQSLTQVGEDKLSRERSIDVIVMALPWSIECRAQPHQASEQETFIRDFGSIG